jgi:DNA mismatch repair protein MutS2
MAQVKFKVGDKVRVVKIKQEGTLIKPAKSGSWVVAMELLPPDKYPSYAHIKKKTHSGPSAILQPLDLHGKRVEEALPLIGKYLDNALIEGYGKAGIMHGLGSGRLLEAVHKYLKQQPFVQSFKLDENNPGVTWVVF